MEISFKKLIEDRFSDEIYQNIRDNIELIEPTVEIDTKLSKIRDAELYDYDIIKLILKVLEGYYGVFNEKLYRR